MQSLDDNQIDYANTSDRSHINTRQCYLVFVLKENKRKKSYYFKTHEIPQLVADLQVLPLLKGVGYFPGLVRLVFSAI